MPENGFVMRFFGCARWGVGVVGAERSIQLSYGRMERAPRSLAERSVFGCYMDWGASTPSRSKALRRVVFRARTRPRRWLVSSGSSGLFTCTTL